MSRLIVLTRPDLVPGFQLAGVDAYGAQDVETAQEMIEAWWIAHRFEFVMAGILISIAVVALIIIFVADIRTRKVRHGQRKEKSKNH